MGAWHILTSLSLPSQYWDYSKLLHRTNDLTGSLYSCGKHYRPAPLPRPSSVSFLFLVIPTLFPLNPPSCDCSDRWLGRDICFEFLGGGGNLEDRTLHLYCNSVENVEVHQPGPQPFPGVTYCCGNLVCRQPLLSPPSVLDLAVENSLV